MALCTAVSTGQAIVYSSLPRTLGEAPGPYPEAGGGGAVLPSSQLAPECPGQHLHSRVVTVLYITLYVGLTTVL